MSSLLISQVFERYPVGGSEMLLALAIAEHAHDDGSGMQQSLASLAHKTRQSTQATADQLGRMQASGWLQLANAGEYQISCAWLQGEDLAPTAATSKSAYPEDFEQAWSVYPKRPGVSKKAAHRAWQARVKSGYSALSMASAAASYASYCAADGVQPQYVKHPATFFGPDLHFLSDWSPVKACHGKGLRLLPDNSPRIREIGASGDVPDWLMTADDQSENLALPWAATHCQEVAHAG